MAIGDDRFGINRELRPGSGGGESSNGLYSNSSTSNTQSNSNIGPDRFGPDRTGNSSSGNGNGSTRSGGGQAAQSLLGGWWQNRMAKKQRAWEEQQNTLAYERSLPWNSTSALGRVTFDPETKGMLQQLSPEMQELMGNYLGLSNRASEELDAMYDDPDKMARDQYNKFLAFNDDAYNQTRLNAKEHAIATGRGGGSQGYYDQLAVDAGINKDKQVGLYNSVGEGMKYRQMLGNESSTFGQLGKDVASSLSGQADLGRAIGQGSNVNTKLDPFASRNYTDTKSNMLSSFMGDMYGRKKRYNQDGKVIQDEEPGWWNSNNTNNKGYSLFKRT